MSIHQKQIESANLSEQVEQWLSQNAVKSLPMGFTHFPDGNIPVSKNKPKLSEAERLQKEREREEQNALIREQKEADRIKRKAEAYLRKLQREREARAAKKAKNLSETHQDLEETKKQIKEQVKRINNERIKAEDKFKANTSEIKENASRWVRNKEARLKAIEAGVKYFTADCKHHGVGTFYLSEKAISRCYTCRLKANRNRKRSKMDAERIEDAERVLRNKARKVAAYAAGERKFVGECMQCGESVFEIVIIKNLVSCRCADCRRAINRKSRAGKRMELQGDGNE